MGLMDTLGSPQFATYLSGLGSALSQADRGQPFDMRETTMLLQQMQQRKQQQEQMAGLMEQFGGQLSPQQQQLLGAMPPEMAYKVMAQQAFPENKSYAHRDKIEALVNTGLDRDTATNLVLGRYNTSRHPVTGETMIIDMATQQPVAMGGQASAGGGGAAGYASPPPAGEAPPRTRGGVDAEVPRDEADFPSAFGAEGVFKNVANIAADFVGAGQVYPDAATASRQIENLNTQTATLLAEGTDTRGGKYLIDRFDKIQAEAGGIQGPEDALKTLQEIKGLLERAHQVNQKIIQSAVKPSEKSNATATLRRLEPMIQEYDQIIDTFQQQYYGPQGGHPQNTQGQPPQQQGDAPPPPEGVDPQLWQFMTPEERALWQN